MMSARGEQDGSVGAAAGGAESWRRAAEVTQNLKARIEMMKVRVPIAFDLWRFMLMIMLG
jgi:hypothetical protein